MDLQFYAAVSYTIYSIDMDYRKKCVQICFLSNEGKEEEARVKPANHSQLV
jgi:hypothetical protein